ncbi:MAG: DUF2087 domain-containing protein [Candidatus Woesearchaeota archaeon]
MLILPRDDIKKVEILKKVIIKFKKNKNYSEEEVSDLIKTCNVDDYVLFRRELVNFNFLGKDSYKGIYWVKRFSLTNEDLTKVSITQRKIKDSNFL